jgi:hypothetical protein
VGLQDLAVASAAVRLAVEVALRGVHDEHFV